MTNSTGPQDSTGQQDTTTGTVDGRSDNELLIAYVGGDTEAFGEFTRRYFPFMVRVAAARIGSQFWHDAEDAATDALLAVMGQADRIRPEGVGDVRNWLASFVRNKAIDISSRRARHATPARDPHVLNEVISSQGYRLPGATGPAETHTEAQREARDERAVAAAEDALSRLTPRQREVMTLRFLHGMTQRDVAAELGVTVKTVKSTQDEARKRLRSQPGAQPGTQPGAGSGQHTR